MAIEPNLVVDIQSEPQQREAEQLIALLRSWMADDPDDQRETLAILEGELRHNRFNIPERLQLSEHDKDE